MSMTKTPKFIFADVHLARRLERAEGQSNKDFVETRARLTPESGAQWIEVAGAWAMFDGVGSPMTQTFGLGMYQTPAAADLAALEQFFEERGADVFHEVSPLADDATLSLLNERGYQPWEFTSVMFRPLEVGGPFVQPRSELIKTHIVSAGEYELWAQTAATGWGESPELRQFILELSRVSVQGPNILSFLAELEGRPIATGALIMCEGVALLAGASTVPDGRQQGAQLALLNARLDYAAGNGCDIAAMGAQPGSASQRNAERQGFRIAYTRPKWQLMKRE